MSESRPRNAGATRASILSAAKSLFAQSGYDGVSLRDIASQVNCNVALVSRYFGGKDELFLESVSEGFHLSDIADTNRQLFGQNLARYILSKRKRGALEPLQALLRSTSNPKATALMQDVLETQFVAPLAIWLGGENAKLRAATIAAIIIGIATTRDVLESSSLLTPSLEKSVQTIAPLIQALVDE
jgi:AcrR family transcriptional regulator